MERRLRETECGNGLRGLCASRQAVTFTETRKTREAWDGGLSKEGKALRGT